MFFQCKFLGVRSLNADNIFPGAFSGGVTPVPIPNTEVKLTRADGIDTAGYRESRSVPGLYHATLYIVYRAA